MAGHPGDHRPGDRAGLTRREQRRRRDEAGVGFVVHEEHRAHVQQFFAALAAVSALGTAITLAVTMASMTAGLRPSEMLGTHSTISTTIGSGGKPNEAACGQWPI